MIETGNERQLFVDDRGIARRQNVARCLHQAKKRDPVLVPEMAWEGERVYCFGTVLRDETTGRYRMWYISRLGEGNEHRTPGLTRAGDMVCLAESPDGISWTRPELGEISFDGSKANNIVFINGHYPSIWHDEQARADERYRMVVNGWGDHTGYTLRHSEDGVHWRFYEESPMFSDRVRNEVMCIARHPRTRRFFAYHRRWADNYDPPRRVIGVSWSDDFRHWSPARLAVVPDELDVRSGFDEPFGTEFYDMSGFWYESQFIGVLPVFLVESYVPRTTNDGATNSPWDGPIEAQLTHSRDGETWSRFEDRTPIIPRGPEGSFDAGCIIGCANTPVIDGGEVRLYYTGVTTTHGGTMPPKRISIGVATWRRDGFVSLHAGHPAGVVETPLLYAGGEVLHLNADAAGGSVSVEVITADGEVRSGYATSECRPVGIDSCDTAIAWRDRSAIDPTHPYRLRFHLRNADLFSYWFA